MTETFIPTIGHRHGPGHEALQAALREAVDGEVRFDAGSRGAYSTDASNFRQVPIGVVVPRTTDALVAAVEVCAAHDVPITNRGGGTSLAGQTCNAASGRSIPTHAGRWSSPASCSTSCGMRPPITG